MSEDIQTMIDDCVLHSDRLHGLECGFVVELDSLIMQGRQPTPKQARILKEIWEIATAKETTT